VNGRRRRRRSPTNSSKERHKESGGCAVLELAPLDGGGSPALPPLGGDGLPALTHPAVPSAPLRLGVTQPFGRWRSLSCVWSLSCVKSRGARAAAAASLGPLRCAGPVVVCATVPAAARAAVERVLPPVDSACAVAAPEQGQSPEGRGQSLEGRAADWQEAKAATLARWRRCWCAASVACSPGCREPSSPPSRGQGWTLTPSAHA